MITRSQALAALSNQFPLMPREDPKAIALGYAVALEGIPDWAAVRAVQAFMRGEVKDQSVKYRPPAPFLAQEAKRQVSVEWQAQNKPILDEQQRLREMGEPNWITFAKDKIVAPEDLRPGNGPVLVQIGVTPPIQ